MAKKIKCGCGQDAELRWTVQKPTAKRKYPSKPYYHCPKCGTVKGSSSSFHQRLIDESKDSENEAPDIQKANLENDVPPVVPNSEKGGLFSAVFTGWGL